MEKNNGYDNWNNKLLYKPFNHVLIPQFTSNAKKGLLKNIEGINSSFLDCSIDFGAINTFVSCKKMPLKVGNNVHVKLNSEWYDGQIIPDFVYKNVHVIIEIIDDRVVIGKDDKISGTIKKHFLEKFEFILNQFIL